MKRSVLYFKGIVLKIGNDKILKSIDFSTKIKTSVFSDVFLIMLEAMILFSSDVFSKLLKPWS